MEKLASRNIIDLATLMMGKFESVWNKIKKMQLKKLSYNNITYKKCKRTTRFTHQS